MLPAKRRSVEKRREISRCAARHRREKEADVFTDLYVTVPIVEEPKVTHVDRIAILRLAASLCRFRQVAGKVLTPNSLQNVEIDNKIERDLLSDLFSETMLGDSLNGFLLVVDSRSSIIYISPNVSRSLGLTQTDLVGQCLNDFLHQDDVAELKQNFADVENGSVGKMFLRMKSVLGARGRNLNLRSALYKAVSFVMTKRQIDNIGNAAARRAAKEINIESDDNDMDDDDENSLMSNEGNANSPKTKSVDNNYFFLHGSLISQYGSVETHSAGAFVTRHSMEMKFSYCHDRLSDYLGYDIKSLMGVSFYSLVHPQDISQLNNDFKELYKKGQVSSGIYRLMAKSGGYVWLTTEASIVTQGTRSGRGQHIVCVHQVISAPEATEILADVQQNLFVHSAAPTKAEGNRKTVMAPKHEIGGSTCDGLVERAPNVTEITTLPNVPMRNHDNFVGSNYESWLFRGCWPNAQHASTTNGSLEECRSKSSFSSNSIAEDVNSPDRSPPLLIVGNESQAYNSQYHTFGFGEGRTDGLSAERTPMLIPADSLGTGGAQSGRNTNMYTTLLDADLSSAEDLTDKLVDLSLLAPFVDTGELVTLDLLAEDLDVPLDFGDFSDLSLDTFTEETKAKFTTSNGGKLSKTDSDPSLASCQLGFNVGGQKYHDQFMGYNAVGGKDLDWPQIIENLSPTTSSHSEVVHQVYRVAVEHPTSNGERAQALKNEQNFGHYSKTAATGCGYKNDASLNGVPTKIHPYINDNLFGFAHDAALSNKVPNIDKSSGGFLHQSHQQQTNFALSHVAQTSGQHQQQNWNHHHQSYKGMPNLHSSHEMLEPLNSHNYAQQSYQLTKAKSVMGIAGIHGGHSRNDADTFQHQNGTNFQPHLVQGSHHHQYKCSTPVFDFERTAQTNSGASNGLKALSSFTHSPANYPQRQPTAPPGMWLPQHIYNNHHASQNFAHGRKCGTAPQTPTQTSSDGSQFQWDVQSVTPDRLRADAHPKIVDCAPFLLPGAKVNQGKSSGTGSSNVKKRLRSDSTFHYSNHPTIGKASDVASPLCGQQFYMNPNVRVNNPPPLVSSNFPWNHNPGSIMMVPNSPITIVDQPTTSEPKIKRLKTSAYRQSYIKIETPFVQGQHHLATHI